VNTAMRVRSASGFTLIEVLVAMGILAVISVITMNMLSAMVSSRENSNEAAERLERLQMTSVLLSRDLKQSVDRSVRDIFGEAMPPLVLNEGAEGAALMLVRAGVETGETASRLQRVVWGIQEGGLYRGTWHVLDGAPATPDKTRWLGHRAASDEIEAWSFRFYYEDAAGEKAYASTWPPPQGANLIAALPQAVEIHLTLSRTGPVEFFYAIPRD